MTPPCPDLQLVTSPKDGGWLPSDFTPALGGKEASLETTCQQPEQGQGISGADLGGTAEASPAREGSCPRNSSITLALLRFAREMKSYSAEGPRSRYVGDISLGLNDQKPTCSHQWLWKAAEPRPWAGSPCAAPGDGSTGSIQLPRAGTGEMLPRARREIHPPQQRGGEVESSSDQMLQTAFLEGIIPVFPLEIISHVPLIFFFFSSLSHVINLMS